VPNLYIISGCNGAGKTTASFTILPEMLNCKEFVNAMKLQKDCLLSNQKVSHFMQAELCLKE